MFTGVHWYTRPFALIAAVQILFDFLGDGSLVEANLVPSTVQKTEHLPEIFMQEKIVHFQNFFFFFPPRLSHSQRSRSMQFCSPLEHSEISRDELGALVIYTI